MSKDEVDMIGGGPVPEVTGGTVVERGLGHVLKEGDGT